MLFPSLILVVLTLCQINLILCYKCPTETSSLSSIIDVNTTNTQDFDTNNTDVTEESNEPEINIEEVMNSCNESFRTTFEFLNTLNKTGKFPDESDKTPMCFVRCVYEKLGLIKDDILNKENIQKMLWPATGDSIEVCQEEGKDETNQCMKTYLKARCLMLRAIVDGKN